MGPKTRAKINEIVESEKLNVESGRAENRKAEGGKEEQIKLIREKLNDLQSQLTQILNQLVERLKNQQ